jgi:glycosyltransferase involved in cell wall biosynthesis
MRILMLSQFYPPIIGGIEQHVRTLSIELAARGHEVSVATFCQKGAPEFEIDQGVHIYRIRATMQHLDMLFSDSERRYAPPFPDPEATYELRRIIMREHPCIIHAHDWLAHSFIPLKAWSKAKLVVTLHDYNLICVQKRLMQSGICCSGPGLMKCLNCATRFYGIVKGPPSAFAHCFWGKRERQAVDMFLPVSQAVVEGNQLTRYKLPYRVIPNFIPDNAEIALDDMNPFLAQLPKEDFLLFVGDVTLDKGGAVLLQAYAEMCRQVPLVLIGRPAIRFSESLPPNVLLMGGWPHEAVMGAWSRCLIALAPSIWHDPCPTVAMEAMSMGKPLIASRIGGLSEIVADGETGILVEPGNARALAQTIQHLLDNPEQREYMGTMAKQKVTEFQARAVISRIEQVYHEIVRS